MTLQGVSVSWEYCIDYGDGFRGTDGSDYG